MGFFIELAFRNPDLYLMYLILVIFSICCHEYSHAQVALWQGDSTAADEGHLTLNPMVQMGPFSLVMCAVIGIAWGAVPVNPSRFRHRYSDALVSFAGPLMNLILFVLFSCGAAIVIYFDFPARLEAMCSLGSILNVVLFIFNMMPIPMLDGAKVFSFVFPKLDRMNEELRNGVTLFLFFFILLSFEVLYRIGSWMSSNLVHFLLWVFAGIAKIAGAVS